VSAVKVGRMPVPQLVTALRKGARANGDWDRVAAVELLIEHESWLHRADFRRFVEMDSDGLAWLDFRGLAGWADDARASSSESAILRLACSLAGAAPHGSPKSVGDPWSLRMILRPLDRVNSARVVEAVRYAALGPAARGGRA
jgi:hypothetical protein